MSDVIKIAAITLLGLYLTACGGTSSFDNAPALLPDSEDVSGNASGGSDTDTPETVGNPDTSTPPNQPEVPNNPDLPNIPDLPPVDLGSALVSWNIPTERVNGDDLTLSEIGGYEILYRRSDEVLYNTVTLTNQNLSQHVIPDLLPGRYEFVITAFDNEGLYSDFSEPAVANIGS